MSHSISEATPISQRFGRWIGRAVASAACAAVAGFTSLALAQQPGETGKTLSGDPSAAEIKAIEDADKKIKAVVINIAGAAVSEPENITELEKAVAAFQKRDFDGARAQLTAAKRRRPELPPVEVMFASICFNFNLPNPARAELERAVLNHPEDPEPYLIFADLAFQGQQVTAAETLFLRAKEKADAFKASTSEANKRKVNFDIRVNAGMAAIHEAREKWPEAIAHLEKWIALDSRSAPAYQRLGRALFKKDPIASAEADEKRRMQPVSAAHLEAAKLSLPPGKDSNQKVYNPYVAMARLYEEAAGNTQVSADRTEWRKRAKNMFEFAVSKEQGRDQKAVDVLLAYASWLLMTGDTAEAKKKTDAALQIDADHLEAQFLKGMIARFSKDWTTAETTFEQITTRQPSNFLASNQLALVLAESGADKGSKAKLARALEYAQMNFDRYKQTQEAGPTAATTLGWVLYRADRKQEAAQYIGAGARAGNLTPDAMYYVAKVLSDTEKGKPEAFQVVKEAMKSKVPFAHKKDAEELHKLLTPFDPEATATPKK